MRLSLAVGIVLLLPLSAGADHACVDGYPMGAPLKLTKPMPAKWFLVGSADVRDAKTHASLKERYEEEYISGYDEGEIGWLCFKLNGSYVAVTTSDFGPGVEYSNAPPKCLKCQVGHVKESEFHSGTGLMLGLSKAKVSVLLGANIASDLSDVTFEETEATGATRTLHSEVLSLEFQNDRLVRFSVYDYREGA